MDGLDVRQKDWKYIIDMDKDEEDLWHVTNKNTTFKVQRWGW